MIFDREDAESRLIQRKKSLEAKVAGREASVRSRFYARTVEIPQVESALARLRDGEYGQCIDCGEDIEADRLTAMPEAPTCKSCGRSRESKKGASHERRH